jgi:hypothetical protein
MEEKALIESEQSGFLDRCVVAIVGLVVVARLLTPTEGADAGQTLWIVQFCLLGLVLWGYRQFRRRSVAIRWTTIDAAVGLLVAGQVVAALWVLATDGDKRAALNMLWEWIGVGTTFFLVRQTIATAVDRQRLALSLVATAVALSGLGRFHQ